MTDKGTPAATLDLTRLVDLLKEAMLGEVAEALGKDCRDLSRQLAAARERITDLEEGRAEVSGRLDNLAERVGKMEHRHDLHGSHAFSNENRIGRLERKMEILERK